MGANFFPSVKVGMMETSSPHVDDNNFNPWQAQAPEFRQSSDQQFPKKSCSSLDKVFLITLSLHSNIYHYLKVVSLLADKSRVVQF